MPTTPTLTEALKLLHPTDFKSARELPDLYAWPSRDDHPSVDPSHSAPPVIDLRDPTSAEQMGLAARSWGVFQIIHHGIPMDVLKKTEAAGMSLFELPTERKLRAARDPDGISGYGLARISSFFSKLMWSEGFTIAGSPEEHARKLWPNDYKAFCDITKAYEKMMSQLAGRLMWLLLGSLGLTQDDIQWAGQKKDFKGAQAAIQMNSYPVCPDPDRAMGLAAHTDSTLLTILYQNQTSGLQVLREGVGWVMVPPLSGGLVVNVGDLLHILTNGLYKTVLHRALVNRIQQRMSIVYLYGPPDGVSISPLPKLVGWNRTPLYRAVSWKQYLDAKTRYFNETLSTIRL